MRAAANAAAVVAILVASTAVALVLGSHPLKQSAGGKRVTAQLLLEWLQVPLHLLSTQLATT